MESLAYKFKIRDYEVDFEGKVPVHILFRHWQEAALNATPSFQTVLGEKAANLIWMLDNCQFEYYRPITKGMNVINCTAVIKSVGPYIFRSYTAYDADSQTLLATGLGKWYIVDAGDRKIYRSVDKIFQGINHHENSAMAPMAVDNTTVYKPIVPVDLPDCKHWPIPESTPVITALKQAEFSDLDRNGHVNNANYWRFISDALVSAAGETGSIKQGSICFRREITLGERFRLNFYSYDTINRDAVDHKRVGRDSPTNDGKSFFVCGKTDSQSNESDANFKAFISLAHNW